MKKAIIASLILMSPAAQAEERQVITLDLTKAETPMEFDPVTGAWTGTMDDDQYTIDTRDFCILHNSMADFGSWWGFTASKSADNSRREDFITYQFSNMAKGGIVLAEDGTVKTDAHGAPMVSADVPYLVGFANSFFAEHPAEMVMADGLDHELTGVYVGLNSYSYYTIADGDSYARAFTEGDRFTLTIHAIDSANREKSLDVTLASYSNGDLTATRGWKYVDLTPLGSANQLWFSMKSTDSGAYGDNTPCYFCLDKLTMKPADTTGIESIAGNKHTQICFDRATCTVTLDGADFAMVYGSDGTRVMTAGSAEFSMASLPRGVYVVKAGNSALKVARL